MDALERFKENALGLRHVSFRTHAVERIINTIKMNYQP